MPIHEVDPWRLQYFSGVETAADIATEDADAWNGIRRTAGSTTSSRWR